MYKRQGLTIVQERRVKNSVIAKYFKDIVISEEVGISKPNPEIFEYALSNIEGVNKNEILMIGDSSVSYTHLTTGSQGEPMASLARIAFSNHRKIAIEHEDTFIISASPIPGNDKLISRVINELFRKGADVIYEDLADVNVSGHAYQEELKLCLLYTSQPY